jgi:triphosphoribosyl-dephospho-CoA synthetase
MSESRIRRGGSDLERGRWTLVEKEMAVGEDTMVEHRGGAGGAMWQQGCRRVVGRWISADDGDGTPN